MKKQYCEFKSITLHKGLLESASWTELTKSQMEVFIYIWSCLQWAMTGTKRKKYWDVINNGDIEISQPKMMKKLGIKGKATCSNAVAKLIEVGLISLTRIGENKVCHKYKMLYFVVPQAEERWRKYPEKNWKDDCPKSPKNLVGRNTRFKTHPKELDCISNNQSKELV